MLVSKQSIITKRYTTLDVDVTRDQLYRIENGMELIQNIVPHLTRDLREFLKTGITPEEWIALFGCNEDV